MEKGLMAILGKKSFPSLNFQNQIVFLKSEEKRLVGKAVKVPVNGELWTRKYLFVLNTYIRFLAYLNTITFDRENEKFLKRFSNYERQMVENFFPSQMVDYTTILNTLPTLYLCNPINDMKFHNGIIKLFLDSQYLPPQNPFEMRAHFDSYLYYQDYTLSEIKFFFPTVNDFINYAGIKLILESLKQIENTIKIETKQDQAKPGADTMKGLSEQKSDAIKNILEKYGIEDLQFFRKDKILREKFMDECRSETRKIDPHDAPLSDERILKKARKNLKATGKASV
ncbi:MAG: hypothetical protein A4E70_01069 [Syntrophus sp. PtaU1.Bin005]|nr:MAG: hypothetical protein A4E70_01069 [Syntrophus sp. PtaU1.Bin005]